MRIVFRAVAFDERNKQTKTEAFTAPITQQEASPDTGVSCFQAGRATEDALGGGGGGWTDKQTETGPWQPRAHDLGGQSLTLAGHARACLSMLGGTLIEPPARLGAAE